MHGRGDAFERGKFVHVPKLLVGAAARPFS